MRLTRRAFLSVAATVVAASAVVPPVSHADDPFTVLVATNEPYGTYHIRGMVDHVESQGGRIALVAPDLDHPTADPVEVITLDQAKAWDADLLVVNGATEWPATVVQSLPERDVVASSLAYLKPEEAPGAAAIRERLVGATAQSSDEAKVFAAHFGMPASEISVVGNVNLDNVPAYQPAGGTVLVATSVTKSSTTGGSAPGTQLLLDTAAALEAEGYHIRVGLHPREDRTLWEQYEIAEEGTIAASATAEVVVGIPGSVFPPVAAVGAPLVGITDPALTVPDYLLKLSATASTVDEVVAAVKTAWKPEPLELEAVVGPVGGSAERLWDYWMTAAAKDDQPKPSPSATASAPAQSASPSAPVKPGLPHTGVAGVGLAV